MYEGPVQNLIDEFGKLPGIGPKSAQRLAFHLLQAEPESVERLRSALQAVVEGVTYCEICGTVAAAERCRICSDPVATPVSSAWSRNPRTSRPSSGPASSTGCTTCSGGARSHQRHRPQRTPDRRTDAPCRPGTRGHRDRRDHHRHRPQHTGRPPAPTSRGCFARSPISWCPGWRRACDGRRPEFADERLAAPCRSSHPGWAGPGCTRCSRRPPP